MSKMKNTPDTEQREKFIEYLTYWQTRFGLMDWRVVFSEKPAVSAMASVSFDDYARMAVVRLGDFGAEKITNESLSMTACHELLHVLLHDLVAADNDDKNVGVIEHRVINMLERLLAGGSI